MNCERCKDTIEKNEEREHHGQIQGLSWKGFKSSRWILR